MWAKGDHTETRASRGRVDPDNMYNTQPTKDNDVAQLLGAISSHSAHYDVVDRDVDNLHEEAHEAHDQEADPSGLCDLRELCPKLKRCN